MADLDWRTVQMLGAYFGPEMATGATSPLAPSYGPTQEYSVERLQRLCNNGDQHACALLKSRRTAGADSGSTPESVVTRAQNREVQAESDRRAIAARLLSAGVSPKIVAAVAAKRDVQYGSGGGISEWINAHPVIAGLAVVAAGGAVAYAYGRRRRR